MNYPPYSPAEARTRETFLALMWAFSYPGRIYRLPAADGNFALIAEALLDLETSFYAGNQQLKPILTQTGARSLSAAVAAYHFYPALTADDMGTMREANVGTMLYPDEAATLIIGCTVGNGEKFVLQGPGIKGQQSILIDGLPELFWEMRDSVSRFPLGWDIYFVDGAQVIGLPRSVRIERI